jgi:hypothetical protein
MNSENLIQNFDNKPIHGQLCLVENNFKEVVVARFNAIYFPPDGAFISGSELLSYRPWIEINKET